jgi:hypothetical protein
LGGRPPQLPSKSAPGTPSDPNWVQNCNLGFYKLGLPTRALLEFVIPTPTSWGILSLFVLQVLAGYEALTESDRFFMEEDNLNQLALDYTISFHLILCATPKGKGSFIQHSQKTISSIRVAGIPGLLSEQVVVRLLANSHP